MVFFFGLNFASLRGLTSSAFVLGCNLTLNLSNLIGWLLECNFFVEFCNLVCEMDNSFDWILVYFY